MMSTMPAAIGHVKGSPKIVAASTAVAAVPDAPQMPYATPTGMPARNTAVSRMKDPTYPATTTASHAEWSWDARKDSVAATSTAMAAISSAHFRTRPT